MKLVSFVIFLALIIMSVFVSAIVNDVPKSLMELEVLARSPLSFRDATAGFCPAVRWAVPAGSRTVVTCWPSERPAAASRFLLNTREYFFCFFFVSLHGPLVGQVDDAEEVSVESWADDEAVVIQQRAAQENQDCEAVFQQQLEMITARAGKWQTFPFMNRFSPERKFTNAEVLGMADPPHYDH